MASQPYQFPQTPTGQRLALGLTHEMVRVNRALDSLRALAYRDGVAPLFSDEGTPTMRPWDTRDSLICDLGEAYGRLHALRSRNLRGYLSDEMGGRVDRLCLDILHHATQLQYAGWLDAHEHPKYIADSVLHIRPDGAELVGHFEAVAARGGPAPTVDARGAAAAPLGAKASLQK